MKLWTYGEALDRINHDLDLDNETFIQDDEMAGYFNEALDDANAEILKLNEDYIRKSCVGNLTQGSSQVLFSGTDNQGVAFTGQAMPPDLYANKIRGVVYASGNQIYLVKRMRGEHMLLEMARANFNPGTEGYRYDLTNPATQSYRMDLVPPARETGAPLKLWYLRNLTRVPYPSQVGLTAARATILDLPEFTNFILAYVKTMCLPKEGDPRTPLAMQALVFHRAQMVSTLSEKVVDNDNRMEMDLSYYGEHN